MNSFTVSWHASGMTGSHNYLVVAEDLEKAKALWDKFISRNKRLNYSWEKACQAVKRHYGGYVSWKPNGPTDKWEGCYELPYNAWNASSDHLRD